MTLDKDLVKALQEDYRTASISEQDRTMLDYVAQLTRDATGINRQDHQRLRSVGFDDRGILQITLIASWFNYINRVADALVVGRDYALSAVRAFCGLLATGRNARAAWQRAYGTLSVRPYSRWSNIISSSSPTFRPAV